MNSVLLQGLVPVMTLSLWAAGIIIPISQLRELRLKEAVTCSTSVVQVEFGDAWETGFTIEIDCVTRVCSWAYRL